MFLGHKLENSQKMIGYEEFSRAKKICQNKNPTGTVSEFIDPVFAETSPKNSSFSIIENERIGLGCSICICQLLKK
jgi:hypothetical protein